MNNEVAKKLVTSLESFLPLAVVNSHLKPLLAQTQDKSVVAGIPEHAFLLVNVARDNGAQQNHLEHAAHLKISLLQRVGVR